MKTNAFFGTGLVIIFVITLLLMAASCTDEVRSEDEDTSDSEQNAFAELVFSNLSSIADEAIDQESSNKKGNKNFVFIGECATVIYDSTVSPRQLTIDFGDTNCLCDDGVYRRGVIHVSHTGRYREEGASHTITTEDYFVNDNQVTGTKTITNNGENEDRNLTFSITVDGSVELANDAGIITWKSAREREWIQGADTRYVRDDIYDITGNTTGTGLNGRTYTAVITKALRKDFTCQWHNFTQGTMELTPGKLRTRIIDYGDGTCDRLAQVTIGNKTFNITLHR